MITFLYGTDSYRIKQREETLKKIFPSNDFNVCVFENSLPFSEIKSAADTLPFLADRKLVIIKGLSETKDRAMQTEIKAWLEAIPEYLEVILIEEKLDARNWLLGIVRSIGKIENFNSLKPYEVAAYIRSIVKTYGGQIDFRASEQLALLVGTDLTRLDNEIKKLITYDQKINLESVNGLTASEYSDSIFLLLDAISEKKIARALKYLNNFLKDDDRDVYLITMLAGQVRNLLMVKELLGSGKRETEILAQLKLHPYVIKKSISQSKYFSNDQLISFHQKIVDADAALKSSNLEPKVLLTQLIYSVCS